MNPILGKLQTWFLPFIDGDEADSAYSNRGVEPVTEARLRALYKRIPSFTNLLPWLDYDPERKAFLLDDGISVAALFDLTPIPSESRSVADLVEIRDKLQIVIADAIPEESQSPWILQIYMQDEYHLTELADRIVAYVQPGARDSQLTQTWLAALRRHIQDITRPGGLFYDEAVTGSFWRGRIRKVRAILYRKRESRASLLRYGASRLAGSPEVELDNVAGRFQSALQTAGILVRRCGGKELYDWMFRWFNPDPGKERGCDTEELLRRAPYPGDVAEKPFGYDFSEMLLLSMPRSENDGTWRFDDLPHKALTVRSLRRIPAIGLFSAEMGRGDHIYALFDRMPENTVLAMTITCQAQEEIRGHLGRIKRASGGDNAEAILAAKEAEKAIMEVAKGNKLFRVQTTFYVRGRDSEDLRCNVNDVESLLLANGLQTIGERDDLLPLDSYIRNLPMRYEHGFDQKKTHRSRLTFASHLANLSPLYGRATGSGNPGFVLFNRGAEPLTFDPLNRSDRKKNGHGLIVGPTGSGKSSQLVSLILQMLAIYRPRIFVVEAGNSFGLLGQYLESQGVSVNSVVLKPGSDVSLPPFSEALKLLRQKRIDLDLSLSKAVDLDDDPYNDYDEDVDDEGRDLLGEMEIAARIMITGGDLREDNRLTRADRLLIQRAILGAAKAAQNDQRKTVLTQDVVQALRDIRDIPDARRVRAGEMADAMALFCNGVAGHFFNRPGTLWPDADVTLVEMGLFANNGYEDKLAVAYIGLMNHIHSLVERYQYDPRPTLMITDEGHTIVVNPLLAPYAIKIVKMWRKFGAWFWIATQSLEDFPDASRKMFGMLEWWICLAMPKDEVEQIARFRTVTPEQGKMLLSARKEPGLYTEGVVLADTFTGLFRSVPPPLALALAMNEKEEKAERQELMRKHGCTELEAVHLVAERIAKKRSGQV